MSRYRITDVAAQDAQRVAACRRAASAINGTPTVLAAGMKAAFTTAVAAATSPATVASGTCLRRGSGNFIFKLLGLGIAVATTETVTWALNVFTLVANSTFSIGGVAQGLTAGDQIIVLGANASTATVTVTGNATATNIWTSMAKSYVTSDLVDIVNYEIPMFSTSIVGGGGNSSLVGPGQTMGWTLTATKSAGTLAIATGAAANAPGGFMCVEELP